MNVEHLIEELKKYPMDTDILIENHGIFKATRIACRFFVESNSENDSEYDSEYGSGFVIANKEGEGFLGVMID